MKRRVFIKKSGSALMLTASIPLINSCREPEAVTACGIPVDLTWFREQSVLEVATHDDLVSKNLVSWPDSLIGFFKNPVDGDYYGFGFGDNGDIMRAHFAADGESIIEGIRVPMRDVNDVWLGSGGPVYYDDASGLLLMITHHEKYDPADPNFFAHVTLRIAVSEDFGDTWKNMGTIIDHNATDETDPNHALTMGNGGFIVKTEGGIKYLYVYHTDQQANGTKNQLAVSRASLNSVISAIQSNQTPVFNKWNGADWSQPGLGGTSVDLMPDFNVYGVVGDFDPFYVTELKKYVAFYPSQIRGDLSPPTWNVLCSMSADGITWEPASKLYLEDISGHDPIYTGVMAHNRVIEGCEANLYRMYVNDTSSRWEFNKLDLVRIALEKKLTM